MALTCAQDIKGGELLVGGIDHIAEHGLQVPKQPLDRFIIKAVSVISDVQKKTRRFGAIVMGSNRQGIVGLIMEDKVALTPAIPLLL